MKMTRRGFLQAMVASMVVVAVPALANVEINPHQKYIDALRMMDETIALSKDPGKRKEMHASWDRLFEYMYDHFEAPAVNSENFAALRNILQRKYSEETLLAELRKIPPTIIDAVWPVAVAACLLREYQLPIIARDLTTYKEFHNRYGALILA